MATAQSGHRHAGGTSSSVLDALENTEHKLSDDTRPILF
jgi:hypothetical protein